MMSIQDKLKEHVKDKCKYCSKKNCEGIKITYDKKAVCEVQK